MEITKLNPRVKQQYQYALKVFIYEQVNERLNKTKVEIVTHNSIKMNYHLIACKYKGDIYSIVPTGRIPNIVRLDRSLHPRMDAYLAEKYALEYNEQPYVYNLITKVLNASESIVDYYRLLPECVHKAFERFESQEYIDAGYHLPSTMTTEQVQQFLLDNEALLHVLKKRVITDLIT